MGLGREESGSNSRISIINPADNREILQSGYSTPRPSLESRTSQIQVRRVKALVNVCRRHYIEVNGDK
jgi:hypothetical protein